MAIQFNAGMPPVRPGGGATVPARNDAPPSAPEGRVRAVPRVDEAPRGDSRMAQSGRDPGADGEPRRNLPRGSVVNIRV